IRLLAISCCVQLSWSCIPMNPGEETKACPAVPKSTEAKDYVTKDLEGPTTENGAKVWKCTAPNYLLRVKSDGTVTKLSTAASLSCKPNSGKFVVVDGVESDAGSDKFICGEEAKCDSCDLSMLVDENNPACDDAMNMFCTSKPINNPTAENCPALSCQGAEVMYLLVPNQPMAMVVTASEVTCKGKWKYNANNDEIPANAVGFVCGKEAVCTECDRSTNMAYTMAVTLPPTETAFPTCTYKCPSSYYLVHNMLTTPRRRKCERCQQPATDLIAFPSNGRWQQQQLWVRSLGLNEAGTIAALADYRLRMEQKKDMRWCMKHFGQFGMPIHDTIEPERAGVEDEVTVDDQGVDTVEHESSITVDDELWETKDKKRRRHLSPDARYTVDIDGFEGEGESMDTESIENEFNEGGKGIDTYDLTDTNASTTEKEIDFHEVP
ncbi:hypothetical protein PFISCL1PPCAC_28060, partial [Pristionchus fissidentatus]